jgi:UDP-glucose:(heptosyl)LPS alpha-1,3-glucosyltransferase
MHIALVRRYCSLKKAGAERYCVNLFRNLQKLGHQVTVVGEGIDDELRGEVEFVPVEVNHLTSWTKNRSFAENVARVVAARRFDVVHGLSRAAGLDSYRLTDPLQTHWVNVYYRNPVERWLQRWNPRHRTILRLERELYEAGRVRRIITQSKLDTRLLTEYFRIPEERIRRIPNGVNLAVFHPGARERRAEMRAAWNLATDEPLIVFAAMDFRRKGLETLLAALSKIHHRRGERPKLLVLGDGEIGAYRRRATSLGLGRSVIFAGRQSRIEAFYGAADLFVLPTIYEPFPNVNLEAMACGLPVITTETAGGADIVVPGENGFLIPDAWAVDELAEQIAQFFRLSGGERERLSLRSIETARRFTVEENARQTAAVLEEVWREKFRV